ncbi:ArpU family phage packaging/lysis transcriptional regulator [Streptococcus hongkongensis]|nr:transcriptional regulator [Streptococcus uberis]
MNNKNAIRKLNEFRRWQHIAYSHNLAYNDDFILTLNNYSKPPYTRREQLSINRECALEELNAIMDAINSIKDMRQRQILILNYLVSVKLNNYDIYSLMGKSESWYYPKKKEALNSFIKYYRGGCLLDI